MEIWNSVYICGFFASTTQAKWHPCDVILRTASEYRTWVRADNFLGAGAPDAEGGGGSENEGEFRK